MTCKKKINKRKNEYCHENGFSFQLILLVDPLFDFFLSEVPTLTFNLSSFFRPFFPISNSR